MIEVFLEWALLQSWLIGAPLVTFVGLMSIPAFRKTATSPTDRARWMKLLRDDRPAERYRSVMRGWLDWLETWLSVDEAQQGPAQRAWSFGLLNFTMALALAYPILAITVQWLAGHAIDFGGQEVIAASPLQARIFVLVWLGSSLILYLFAARSKPRWQWPLLILVSGIHILGSIYADSFAVPNNVAGAFAVAFADAFAVAGRSRSRIHRETLSPPSGLAITLLRRFDGRCGRGDQNVGCFWWGPAQPGSFPHADPGPLAAVQRAV